MPRLTLSSYSQHFDTFSRLSKLRVLALVLKTPMHIMICEQDIIKTVTDNLFSCCANLEYVDVESSMGNSFSGCFSVEYVGVEGSLGDSSLLDRSMRYVSKRHGASQNGDYSWDKRHLFVQSEMEDM